MDAVLSEEVCTRYGTGDEAAQDVVGDPGGRLLLQLDKGDLGRPVDADEQVELAFFVAYLGDVDVDEVDRVDLELALGGLLAFDLRQA